MARSAAAVPDTTPSGPASSALDEIRAFEQAATPGPWEAEDHDDCWQLFGAVTTFGHPMQLIKAPKSGTPYAEYWPDEADADFIVTARTAMPLLVAAIERALELAAGWERKADEADDRAEAASERGDKDASLLLSGRGQALHDCSFALREAITRELTKGETGDG